MSMKYDFEELKTGTAVTIVNDEYGVGYPTFANRVRVSCLHWVKKNGLNRSIRSKKAEDGKAITLRLV